MQLRSSSFVLAVLTPTALKGGPKYFHWLSLPGFLPFWLANADRSALPDLLARISDKASTRRRLGRASNPDDWPGGPRILGGGTFSFGTWVVASFERKGKRLSGICVICVLSASYFDRWPLSVWTIVCSEKNPCAPEYSNQTWRETTVQSKSDPWCGSKVF
jgi:hypothetical protein